MEAAIPRAPTNVMGTPNMNDVTTMANIRRMQFKAAWCTTDIRVKIKVEAKLGQQKSAEAKKSTERESRFAYMTYL
jgi:hypothetical protein